MNRLEDLRQTLDSYAAGDSLPDQVIVVDQTPEHPELIKALVLSYADRFPVEYVYQATPSITAARNNGMKHAAHRVLLFSDDDITVGPETLSNVRSLMADRQLAMLGGLDRNMEVSRGRLGYLFCKKSWKKRDMGHVTSSMLGVFPRLPLQGSCPTEWAMGFFFAVRFELVERWGLHFDEKLTSYAYAEDLDFTHLYYRRAIAEGMRCEMSEGVQVWHRVSRAARTPGYKHTMMYVLNRYYLSYKHFPKAPGRRLALEWSLLGDLALRTLKKQAPGDLAAAMRFRRRVNAKLRRGQLDPDWYQPPEKK